jgi:hypothetical protein
MIWDIIILHHGASISVMSGDPLNGRNLKDGYTRGCGLQFGNIVDLCAADPLFAHAYGLTHGRTAVTDYNLRNLFLLIKFYLPRLPPGDIAEFGSFRGGSAIFMAVVAQELFPGTKVYGFDSFAGMPQTDARRDAHKAGDFGEVSVDEIRLFAEKSGVRNLELVKGMFDESIPRALPSIGALRQSHIDCDLYDGVVASYDGCRIKMVPGGYIVFDDPLVSSCLGAFEAIENLVIRARRPLCQAGVPASGLSGAGLNNAGIRLGTALTTGVTHLEKIGVRCATETPAAGRKPWGVTCENFFSASPLRRLGPAREARVRRPIRRARSP